MRFLRSRSKTGIAAPITIATGKAAAADKGETISIRPQRTRPRPPMIMMIRDVGTATPHSFSNRPRLEIGCSSALSGMEGDVVTMQEIFRFNRMSTDAEGTITGEFRATGIRPKFVDELDRRGVHLPDDLFRPDRVLG